MFFTEVKIKPEPGLIAHGEEMWTIGSCFADEIGTRLRAELFQVRVNPCGTLYNPASIAAALRRISDGTLYASSDLFLHNGLWHCMDFHSSFSAPHPDAALRGINSAITSLHRALPSLRTLMLTFGSTHTFVDTATGRVAGNCHKLPAARFRERDMTCDEIVNHYLPLLENLHAAAPRLHVVFTVSPIRHKAYGFHADRLSKATLLLAVDRLCRETGAIYFPAYEIMNDELRDYRFYAADMIHPSPVACDHIYARFREAFLTPATGELADECRRLSQRFGHRPSGGTAAQNNAFMAENISLSADLEHRHPELGKAMSMNLNLSSHQN